MKDNQQQESQAIVDPEIQHDEDIYRRRPGELGEFAMREVKFHSPPYYNFSEPRVVKLR